jgi:hypothetical protein
MGTLRDLRCGSTVSEAADTNALGQRVEWKTSDFPQFRFVLGIIWRMRIRIMF